MPAPLDHVYEQAMKLTENDRGELAARLLDSLAPEDELEESWAKEIRRRIEEIDQGEANMVSWAEARRIITDTSDGD